MIPPVIRVFLLPTLYHSFCGKTNANVKSTGLYTKNGKKSWSPVSGEERCSLPLAVCPHPSSPARRRPPRAQCRTRFGRRWRGSAVAVPLRYCKWSRPTPPTCIPTPSRSRPLRRTIATFRLSGDRLARAALLRSRKPPRRTLRLP